MSFAKQMLLYSDREPAAAPRLRPLDHRNETQEEKLKDEMKLYFLGWKQKNMPSDSLYVVYLCVEPAVSGDPLNYIWYNLK